jgi:hypothetical protein
MTFLIIKYFRIIKLDKSLNLWVIVIVNHLFDQAMYCKAMLIAEVNHNIIPDNYQKSILV